MKKLTAILGVAILAVGLLCGCKTQTGFIVMASATTIGFDVSYNGIQPQATLAYKRAEVEFVPCTTNYTPDTLMELRFNSSLFTSSGGIYSRMATGPNATRTAAASLMMSKDRNGNVTTNLHNGLLLSFPRPSTIETNK